MQKLPASHTSGETREIDSGQKNEPVGPRAATTAHKQLLLSAGAAAVAFVVVLLLLSHAARSSAPGPPQNNVAGKQSQKPKPIRIEWLTQQFRTNAAGIPELEASVIIKNLGADTIDSTNLKCRFKTKKGEETFLEVPLIVPTSLEDLQGAPLGPYETREFTARIGDFPPDLQPEILDAELVHISFWTF